MKKIQQKIAYARENVDLISDYYVQEALAALVDAVELLNKQQTPNKKQSMRKEDHHATAQD